MGIDLSFNHFDRLQDTVLLLSGIPSLRMLTLKGNPIQIMRMYSLYVLGEMSNLKYFDDEEIKVEDDTNKDLIVTEYATLLKK